jgi:hypothetical protein
MHYPTELAQEVQLLTHDMGLGERADAALDSAPKSPR